MDNETDEYVINTKNKNKINNYGNKNNDVDDSNNKDNDTEYDIDISFINDDIPKYYVENSLNSIDFLIKKILETILIIEISNL